MSALAVTRGLLVSSVNSIVMVSSSVNPVTSPPIVPSGSSAIMEIISGAGGTRLNVIWSTAADGLPAASSASAKIV